MWQARDMVSLQMSTTEEQAVTFIRGALAFAIDETLADLYCERNHLVRLLAVRPIPPLETDCVRLVDYWRAS